LASDIPNGVVNLAHTQTATVAFTEEWSARSYILVALFSCECLQDLERNGTMALDQDWENIPITWRNWFYVRCILHNCPFMADTMGAHCTIPKCNARVQLHFSQIDQWRSITKLYERDTQQYFEGIADRLINKET